MPLLLPVAAQQARLPGDLRRYRQELQAVQEGPSSFLFALPEASIHLREVHCAAGKNVALVHELFKESGAAKPPVEVIENHRRIQQDDSQSGPPIAADGMLKSSVGLGTDFFNIGRAALRQFRMMIRIPCAGGELEGLALFVAPHVPPKQIDDIWGPPLVLGLSQ